MRILMLTHAGAVHAQRWARALIARGHGVTIWSRGAEVMHPDGAAGLEVIPFSVPDRSLTNPWGWNRRYISYVQSVMRLARADVLHIHYLKDYYFTRKDLQGRSLVVSVWGSDVTDTGEEEPVGHEAKVALLEEADQLTATTHFLADECRRYAGRPLGEIEVIPFGVETERFAAARENADRGKVAEDKAVEKPPGALRIGFIKHLREKYGPEFLIQAVPALAARFPSLEVVMAGDGPMRGDLMRMAADLGVADRITWLGYIPYDQVPAVHASLDVFVMPSVYASESFGVAAVEAQAAGVPVVASDFPGIREAVADGVGGVLVPPRNAAAIATAVGDLLADADRRRAMGAAGRTYVRERYEWSRNVDAMEDVYRRVLATAAGRA